MGHPWPILPIGILCALTADLIMKTGKYRKWSCICIGYIVFSEFLIGLVLPFFVMRESYFAVIRDGYGDTYTEALMMLTPLWVLPVMVILTAVGALMGAYLGKAVLKKHFKRAGIV